MSTYEERAEAAYQASLKIIEGAERTKAWVALFDDIRRWLGRNWKLLLGILIGYFSATVIIYLDRWLQAIGVTR